MNKASVAPLTETNLCADELATMLKLAWTGRFIDDRSQIWNRQGKAPFVLSGAGHEVAQAACSWPLQPGRDWLVPYYRDTVVCLRMQLSPYEILLSVLAKLEDPASSGRQTPGHFSSRRLKIVSGGSPVATQVVHAAGLAAALIQDDPGAAVFTSLGEGATSEGDFYEGVNFAAIHHAPLIILCENNGYAISVPTRLQMPVARVADRAAGMGIVGVTVDGHDPQQCYSAAADAFTRARQGGGPTLIEALVDRLMPHSTDDDQKRYRSLDEIAGLKDRDALPRMERWLVETKAISQDQVDEIRTEAKRLVDEDAERALASVDPEPERSLQQVYAPGCWAQSTVVKPSLLSRSQTHPSHLPALPADGPEANMVTALNGALASEMERDPSMIVLGEDVGPKGGVFRVTEGLASKFGPKRVIDTPLAESSIVGVAAGYCLAGSRPVVEIPFADFIHMGTSQLLNEVAKFRYRTAGDWVMPMTIRAPYGGGVRGALYHSQSIEALFARPGLIVVAASNPADAAGLLRSAIRADDPVLFLEHKRMYRLFKAALGPADHIVEIGPVRISRSGSHASVFAWGLMHYLCLQAAQTLASEGIDIEVVDVPTLYPLDRDGILESVRHTARALVVYEDNFSVSVGSEIAATIAQYAFDHLDAPVARLGSPDVPSQPYAKSMEDYCMPNVEEIVSAMRQLVNY